MQSRLDEYEAVLGQMVPVHEQLITCAERKKAVVRRAAIGEIPAICDEERKILLRLQRLDAQRQAIMEAVRAVEEMKADAGICDVAALAEEPQRDRLLVHAARLRDLSTTLRRESTVVRTAAEALHKHMTGLVQTVNAAISQARLYGARGQVRTGGQLDCCVDVTS